MATRTLPSLLRCPLRAALPLVDATLSVLRAGGVGGLAETPDMPDTLDDGRHGQSGEDHERRDQADGEAEAGERHAGDDDDETLGARGKADVRRQADPLGACVRVADDV